MKNIILTLIAFCSVAAFAAPQTAVIEGLVDLSKNDYGDWKYAGHYTETYKVRVTVNAEAQGPAKTTYGHRTWYSDGFRYDACWTTVEWAGGEIKAELFESFSGNKVGESVKPMLMSYTFEDVTGENSTCYPHDYPTFTKPLVLSWDYLEIQIDNNRKLRVRPFAFLDPFTLWVTGRVDKENGQYVLRGFSLQDGLADEIYDSDLKQSVPALRYMFWDHFNAQSQLKNTADAHGAARDMQLK